MYRDKELEYSNKRDEWKRNRIKYKETELEIKNKSIDNLRDSVYKNEKDKVEMEIKVYIETIENNANLNN